MRLEHWGQMSLLDGKSSPLRTSEEENFLAGFCVSGVFDVVLDMTVELLVLLSLMLRDFGAFRGDVMGEES